MATRKPATNQSVESIAALVSAALRKLPASEQARVLANVASTSGPSAQSIATCKACCSTGRPIAPRTGMRIVTGLQVGRCLCCLPKAERPEGFDKFRGCSDGGDCASGMLNSLEYLRKQQPDELKARLAIAGAHPVTEVKA